MNNFKYRNLRKEAAGKLRPASDRDSEPQHADGNHCDPELASGTMSLMSIEEAV